MQRLRYQAAGSTDLLEWLDRRQALGDGSTDEIVQAAHASQAAANLTLRNLIISMRAIAAFDWRSFFEQVSLVDATLRQHAGYVAMDFTKRDRYRHAIEDWTCAGHALRRLGARPNGSASSSARGEK